MSSPSRDDLIHTIRTATEPLDTVFALSEGGSAAFGAVDEWSDIDLVADVAEGAEELVFEAVEAALETLAPITARWHIPPGAWHGLNQRFYLLEGVPETLYVDLALRGPASAGAFTEVEQHGHAVILFDKTGVAASTHLDPEVLATQIEEDLTRMRDRLSITGTLCTKELARGRLADAMSFYWNYSLTPLVMALRIRHCPQRHRFGLRYLDQDLPEEVHAALLPLCLVSDLEDLGAKDQRCRDWLAELLRA